MTQSKRWWLASLLLPAALLIGAVGSQDQNPEQRRNTLRFSELQFVDATGTLRTVSANDLLELRLHRDGTEGSVLIELYYSNKDYTLMHVTGFELIRRGANSNEVVLLSEAPLIFPNIP